MRRWPLVGAGVLGALWCAHALFGSVPIVPTAPIRGPVAGSSVRRVPPGSAGEPRPPGRQGSAASKRTRVPEGARPAVVTRVVDGDTLDLRFGSARSRVRLIGVDAPEIWSRRDCFGPEAIRALRRLLPPGSAVRVASDVERRDRYGRRLGYLWTVRGLFVQSALLRAGVARTLTIPPNTAYAAPLARAQAIARRAGVGLWTACS